MPKDVNRSERAAALIIVLAFVVLLTGLAVAYLSRVTSDRQIANSSFNQSKADELAASAADLIIGDLRNEIANGSSPTPTASVPNSIPTPLPSVFPLTTPAYVVPMRNPTPTPGTTPAIPNLIRRSVRSDEAGGANSMPSPSPGIPSHASAVNSSSPTEASANGRYVKLSRWNKHYLIPRPTTLPTPLPTDTTPISAFNALAPDWVLLTRNGPTAFSAWNASLADPTQSNNNYCVGRYAFAIYDEGGLLDANVAGYPSSATTAQYGPKGVAAFADLTVLGLSGGNGGDIDQLVGLRNYLSTGPTGNFPSFKSLSAAGYVNTVLSNRNGFTSVAVPSPTPNNMSNTDQQFTTRQSLIQLAVSVSTNAVNALQYLGTFSRELNAPTWAPTISASATPSTSPGMGAPNNGPGNIYAYAANANSGTTINPNLLNVKVLNSFTRADGTTAVAGEPLIKRRFPLTRISGLGPAGVVTTLNSTLDTVNGVAGVAAPASATTVQRDFGLVWNNTNNWWDYAGPTGSTPTTSIEPLVSAAPPNVVNDNREPNFFELLKAAILNGSLGMGSGSGNTFVSSEARYYDTAHGCSDYQIIQIGANIISQWNSGNVPIFINFYDTTGNYLAAGINNLPYLNKLVFLPYWTSVTSKGVTTYKFDAWLIPSLWNPHQNAAAWAGNVRIAMTRGKLTAATTSPSITVSSITASPTPISMVVNANAFATPSAVTTATNVSTGIDNSNQLGYYGFHVGVSPTPIPSPAATPQSSSSAYPTFQVDSGNALPTFQMQVDVTGKGTWMPYQTWKGCAQPVTPLACAAPSPSNQWFNRTGAGSSPPPLQDPEFITLDPRTLRFGVSGNAAVNSGVANDYTTGATTTLDVSANPSPSPGTFEKITALPPQSPNFSPSPIPAPTPNLYLCASNADTTVLHYTDLDGVMRQGDVITSGFTSIMQPGNSADRPVILSGTYPNPTPSAYANGGFQSVAELGQVFRDQPWKTLSFTNAVTGATANSADAGLLDVFTLHESSMEAGKTSLNTKQPLVLKALLSQASKDLKGNTLISSTDLNNIITALTDPATGLTTTQPMVNKAELVTRLAAQSSVTGLGNKTAREAVLRAFADTGQTRTWNLLIDVIAQSGRYPPNAGSGPNTTNPLANFMVDGEQHYWVHVAIDRFTGQVLDKQIEVVNE